MAGPAEENRKICFLGVLFFFHKDVSLFLSFAFHSCFIPSPSIEGVMGEISDLYPPWPSPSTGSVYHSLIVMAWG